MQPIMQPFFRNALFEGVLRCNANGEFTGELRDVWGESRIEGILKNREEEMDFRKQYFNGDDLIFYSFRKQGVLWIGAYVGLRVGIGRAQCEIFDNVPRIDWDKRVFIETFHIEASEDDYKYSIEKMVQSGFLERYRDSKTGEEMVRLTDRAKRFDIHPGRN